MMIGLTALCAMILVVSSADVEAASSLTKDGTCEAGNQHCEETKPVTDDPSSMCSVYLAESTIPNAGLGVYTRRELHPGDTITDGDIAIPLLEVYWNNDYAEDYVSMWDDYTWIGAEMGMDDEALDVDYVQACVTGFEAVLNYHVLLTNVNELEPTHDSAGLSRSSDHGVGAFTYYHRRAVQAAADVPAGGELFVNYGESWITDRYKYRFVPLSASYRQAWHVAKKFFDLGEKHDIDEHIQRDLWKIATGFHFQSRMASALPPIFDDAKVASKAGLKKIAQREGSRSLEWLETNGMCADNLRVADSTIRQAGRGAFSTRHIAEGSVVAPAPLVHIPDKDTLKIYGKLRLDDGTLDQDEWGLPIRTDEVVGRQLILNYCFGHLNSTILLCPYGSAASTINHDSKSPNVAIRWAEGVGSTYHHPSWLDYSVDDIKKEEHPGLGFIFVALRDIQPGEEVFLDYGTEWESAWEAYVKDWKPWDDPLASKYNENLRTPLRTMKEQDLHPYPANLILKCSKNFLRLQSNWQQLKESGKLEEALDGGTWVECSILSRDSLDDGTTVYTAEFHGLRKKSKIDNMPREAFYFEEAEPSGDMHLRNSFRHEIGIPDSMFPTAWRNKE